LIELHWSVIAALVLIGIAVGIAVGGWIATAMIEDVVRRKLDDPQR